MTKNIATIVPSTEPSTCITIHGQAPDWHPNVLAWKKPNGIIEWKCLDNPAPDIQHWHDGTGAGFIIYPSAGLTSIYDVGTFLAKHFSGYRIAPAAGFTFADYRTRPIHSVLAWPKDLEPSRTSPKDKTLNQVLQLLGFTTGTASTFWSVGSREILRDGKTVFTGDAQEVWAWLRHEGTL